MRTLRSLWMVAVMVAVLTCALATTAFADDTTYEASVTVGSGTAENYTTLEDAVDAANKASGTILVTLYGDVTTSATLTIKNTMTLDLAGFDITADTTSSDFSVITIVENGNLTLTDTGDGTGQITGGTGTSVNEYQPRGGGIFLYNSGQSGTNPTLTIAGGNITGNTVKTTNTSNSVDSNAKGGGVFTWGACAVTMTAGTISNNSAQCQTLDDDSHGGGVYISGDSSFTMSGGSIEKNYAEDAGAGVYAAGAFTLSGTATITENKVGYSSSTSYDTNETGQGGGVYTGSASTFTMTGGTISNNVATDYGAGVYATGIIDVTKGYDGFTMSGGTITGNISKDGGGGVYLKGNMTMTAGTISNNTAAGEGGGIYINDDSAFLKMMGGTIGGSETAGNTAGDGGGGVYIDKAGKLDMTGGEISYNKAKNDESGNYDGDPEDSNVANDGNGGGVYISSGTFTMEGGTIEYNEAISDVEGDTENGNGGGVYVNYDSATFYMNGGTIQHNTAEYKGGGVYVYDTFYMGQSQYDIGTITGNTAAYGGGVYINAGVAQSTGEATFQILRGNITDNTATVAGGGVYGNTGSVFAINGDTADGDKTFLTGNTAPVGEGVYVVGTMYADGYADIQEVYLTSGTFITVDYGLNSTIPVVTADLPEEDSPVKIPLAR